MWHYYYCPHHLVIVYIAPLAVIFNEQLNGKRTVLMKKECSKSKLSEAQRKEKELLSDHSLKYVASYFISFMYLCPIVFNTKIPRDKHSLF